MPIIFSILFGLLFNARNDQPPFNQSTVVPPNDFIKFWDYLQCLQHFPIAPFCHKNVCKEK